MTADHASLSHHPAPHRDQVSAVESAFGLLGAPCAWFVDTCIGYAMANWPCFPNEQRRAWVEPDYAWTTTAILMVSMAAMIVSLAAYVVSRRIYTRVQDESHGDHQHLLDVGSGRTRFLALWGMVLSAAFAAGIAINLIAFFVLPRCGG